MTETKKESGKHKATFALDKRTGTYKIRVSGEHADVFGGREVPVTKKDGTKTFEKLLKLTNTYMDDTQEKVAYYTFVQKEKPKKDEKKEDIEF